MSGNMSEWCKSKLASSVEAYPQLESLTNELHRVTGTYTRVLRGGGWGSGSTYNPSTGFLRCSGRLSQKQARDRYDPAPYGDSVSRRDFGFRVVRRSLAIDPPESTVTVVQVFQGVGGVPPYSWSVASGIGSVNPSTGFSTTYTRLAAGTNTLTCTDAAGLTATTTVIQP